MERLGPLKSTINQALIQALFWELRRDNIQASYTTKDDDLVVNGFKYFSLKKLYLDCMDPTEEKFVQLAFDGNRIQWERIKNSEALSKLLKRTDTDVPWFDEWKYELELRLQSEGIEGIRDIASDPDNKQNFQALKWLAEKGWDKSKGRPTKSDIEKERKLKSASYKEIESDLNRMEHWDGLRVVDN